MGYMDADGWLYLVDRSKDLIISSGYNVYPRMIEEAVYEHPAVDECIVIGIPDAYRQEAPKVFVKLKPGMSLTFDDLKKHLEGKIGKHEMPVALEVRAELPKTPVGKLSTSAASIRERAPSYRAAPPSVSRSSEIDSLPSPRRASATSPASASRIARRWNT